MNNFKAKNHTRTRTSNRNNNQHNNLQKQQKKNDSEYCYIMHSKNIVKL